MPRSPRLCARPAASNERKENRRMNPARILLLLAALVLAAGCSGWGNKTQEYKGAAARTEKPLEVPPELTAPTMDDRYSVPDPRAVTSFSTYNQKTPQAAAAATPVVAP